MAWWLYLGKVTTPIDGGISASIDESGEKPVIIRRDPAGPTVLIPRLRFEAPMSSVAHLTRLKMVVPLKPHMIPKEAPPTPAKKEPAKVVTVAPVVVPKSEEKPKEAPSDGNTSVVTSSPAKEEPMKVPQDADSDTDEEKSKVQQEKQSKGGRKVSSKRRG